MISPGYLFLGVLSSDQRLRVAFKIIGDQADPPRGAGKLLQRRPAAPAGPGRPGPGARCPCWPAPARRRRRTAAGPRASSSHWARSPRPLGPESCRRSARAWSRVPSVFFTSGMISWTSPSTLTTMRFTSFRAWSRVASTFLTSRLISSVGNCSSFVRIVRSLSSNDASPPGMLGNSGGSCDQSMLAFFGLLESIQGRQRAAR